MNRSAKDVHLLTFPECRACGTEDDVIVHHLRYRGGGKEQPGDVVTMCVTCHNDFHRMLGRRGTSVEGTLDYCRQVRSVMR